MASSGEEAEDEIPPQTTMHVPLRNFLNAFEAELAKGEAADENFVIFDASARFSGLPPVLAESAKEVGKAWGIFEGEVTRSLGDIFEQVQQVAQRGTRAQFLGCTGWSGTGTKCNVGTRSGLTGKRTKLYNLCKTHIREFCLFASWLEENWHPVQMECTNCSAKQEDGELNSMVCYSCARGIHIPCLLRAVNRVEQGASKLPTNFGTSESDFYVCSSCIATDWAKVVMQAEFILGQLPNARFVVAPPDEDSDPEFVLEDWARLQQDAAQGHVPGHFKVALKPVRRGQAQGGATGGGQPSRRFRGGSVSASLGSLPAVRPGRREPTRDGAESLREQASSETEQQGRGATGTRGGRLRQQDVGGRDLDREEFFKYVAGRLESEGKLAQQPLQGAKLERQITLKLVQGEVFGVSTGQIGAFDCAEAHAHEPMHGQGLAMGTVHAKKVTMVLGCGSVSSTVPTFDPESKVKQKGFTLVDGKIEAEEAASLDTPLQYTWFTFVDGMTRLWIRVADSGLGVFDPDHDDYKYFVGLAHLIVHRYFYLVECAKKLMTGRHAVSWEVAWRYITAYIAEFFAGVLPTDSVLDLQLMNISEDDSFRRNMLVAALVKIDPYMLQKAKEAAMTAVGRASGAGVARAAPTSEVTVEAVAARVVAIMQEPGRGGGTGGAGGGGGARQAPAPAAGARKKCPLCLSSDHVYHAGNYGHTAKMAITQACTKPVADGTQCGLKHAYTGPLLTPCREPAGAERG